MFLLACCPGLRVRFRSSIVVCVEVCSTGFNGPRFRDVFVALASSSRPGLPLALALRRQGNAGNLSRVVETA